MKTMTLYNDLLQQKSRGAVIEALRSFKRENNKSATFKALESCEKHKKQNTKEKTNHEFKHFKRKVNHSFWNIQN